MADLHEVLFQWPHSEPTNVILTGTFDQWSRSMQLTKGPAGFKGSVKLPWNVKIAYKFIVDGQWMLVEHEPTEPDFDGNVNNVYTAPPKPPSHAPETGSGVVTGSKPASRPTDSGDAPLAAVLANDVKSGPGNTAGTDPIDAEQIAVPSPKPDTASAPSVAIPEAPVPVNVSENTTTTDPIPSKTYGEETVTGTPHPAAPAAGVKEPVSVTTPPALSPNAESITDAPPSLPEVQNSVTSAEVPLPVSAAVTVNGTSVLKPDAGLNDQATVTGEQANGSQPTNGHEPPSVVPEDVTKTSTPSGPPTPAKDAHQRSPSSTSSSFPRSSTSNVGTAERRKRKSSFFQKLKHLFTHDKDKQGKK